MPTIASKADALQKDFDSLERQALKLGAELVGKAADAAARRFVSRRAGASGFNAETQVQRAILELAELTTRVMAFADLLARVRVVRDAKADARVHGNSEFARACACGRYRDFDAAAMFARISEELPDYLSLPFAQAIEDFASREPEVARNAEQVAEVYQRHGFSMARSVSNELNRQVQQILLRSLADGVGMDDLLSVFRAQSLDGFTDAYARTVFRTNISTAQNAGRLEMSRDPDLSGVLVGWEYYAWLDANTRPNHRAMHEHRAALDAPVWRIWIPPNGYQCRCQVLEISRWGARAMRDMKRLDDAGKFVSDPFPNVKPDPNFEQSPSGAIYGS